MGRWGAWLRVAGGAAILAVVVAHVGVGPFVEAARSVDPLVLTVAVAVTAVTTACSAWRWRLVARGLGMDVRFGAAVGAYYRSQFLNATLPGGVLGDVHRALRHGRETGRPRRSAVGVVGERAIGQAVQVAATGAVLLAAVVPLASVVVAALLLVALARWPGIVGASLVAAAGHVAVFLVAAHAVGSEASTARLLPLALVVLLAAAVPLNVAGWGPREGAAAWGFAAAGLGAAEGATVAATYGVIALVATLPGAVLLATGRRDPARPDDRPALEGAARG